MFKIKAIATLYAENNEQEEARQLKTVKLQVGRGTTVREFVAEAMKKANLGSSFGCVDVQYFSKKFDKFLDVEYGEIVKNGREYNVRVIWDSLAIKKMQNKATGEDATIMKNEDDLSTCKSYGEGHGDVLTCSAGIANEKVVDLEFGSIMHHPTCAEVVSSGGEAKEIVVAKKVNVDVKTSEGDEVIDECLKAPKQIGEIKKDIDMVKNDAIAAKEHIVTFSEQLVVFGKSEQEVKKIEEVVVNVPSSTPPISGIKKKGWFEAFFPAFTKR